MRPTLSAILVISCIDDEITFVDGARENSINPFDANTYHHHFLEKAYRNILISGNLYQFVQPFQSV
jgi:hypothetical protein